MTSPPPVPSPRTTPAQVQENQRLMGSTMKNQPQGLVLSQDVGRALDTLIGEKVMGGQVFAPRQPTRTVTGGFREADGYREEVIDWLPVGGLLGELPEFSADIVAAWLIVERMHADGWWIDIERDASGYLVVMEPFDPEDLRRVERRAATAPHAICLAARATLENPDA